MDTNIKIKKLQQKIRDLRKVHKLSGTEMAKDMNEKYNISLNKGTISKWENGLQTPSTEYIFYLCDYFKVDANWFLGLKKQNSERKNAIKDKKEKIEKVGQFLKEKRKEKNLSMENLVKEIKRKYKKPLNKGRISAWENGNCYPTPEYVIALCDFFEIDANIFLGYMKKQENFPKMNILRK